MKLSPILYSPHIPYLQIEQATDASLRGTQQTQRVRVSQVASYIVQTSVGYVIVLELTSAYRCPRYALATFHFSITMKEE